MLVAAAMFLLAQLEEFVPKIPRLAVAVALLLSQEPAGAGTSSLVDGLAWLEGDWLRRTKHGEAMESWERVSANTMEGLALVRSHGSTRVSEHLRIERFGNELFYIAKPAENPFLTPFKLVEYDDTRFVFENPNYDFPQRITYTRKGEDSLLANIEGLKDGEKRAVDFEFQRRTSLVAGHTGEVAQPSPLEVTWEEARSLLPLAETELGRAFLDAAETLPPMSETRTVFLRRRPRTALRHAQYETLPESARVQYKETQVDEDYYYRLYSTPTAYLRAIDFAAEAGLDEIDGRRVADFGFGNMGQLRMLASLGANVVGIEIDGFHDAFLGPEDEGPVARASTAADGPEGSVTLVFGQFPATDDIVSKVGKGFSLFMSKNTLKLGYIHPEREADPNHLVHLGVNDETFLRHVFDCLAPGGLFLVYNLYGQQSPPDESYKPWATGEFPFARTTAERLGFEVVHWNWDDSESARRMGRRLGWNEGQTDEEFARNFNAMVTVLRKPRG